MQPRAFYPMLAALGLAVVGVSLAPRHYVSVLERLAPRIERTQALTPESREIILQVVQRARDAGADPRHDERRTVAIQRVTDALNARDARIRPASVGQGTADR